MKPLTSRQLEVLELMAKGLTNREIGRVLGISAGTAKLHVSAVIEVLGVTNHTEAATRLHELGLGAGREETRDEFTVAGFGTRPAVAVRPFDSFSSDPEQEFLADGIVEDLITALRVPSIAGSVAPDDGLQSYLSSRTRPAIRDAGCERFAAGAPSRTSPLPGAPRKPALESRSGRRLHR